MSLKSKCPYPNRSNHCNLHFHSNNPPPIIPPSSTASISTQTKPPFPTISESSESPVQAVLISEPQILAIIDSVPFNWANNTPSLSTIPLILSKQPHDLSSLRSSSKNLFSSLHHCHHYQKCSQNFSSNQYTHLYQTHLPFIVPHHSSTTPLIGIMIHAFSSLAMF